MFRIKMMFGNLGFSYYGDKLLLFLLLFYLFHFPPYPFSVFTEPHLESFLEVLTCSRLSYNIHRMQRWTWRNWPNRSMIEWRWSVYWSNRHQSGLLRFFLFRSSCLDSLDDSDLLSRDERDFSRSRDLRFLCPCRSLDLTLWLLWLDFFDFRSLEFSLLCSP